MDIAAYSMISAQQDAQAQAGMAMLAKGLDSMRQEGADLVSLMAQAAPMPAGVGRNVDVFA